MILSPDLEKGSYLGLRDPRFLLPLAIAVSSIETFQCCLQYAKRASIVI